MTTKKWYNIRAGSKVILKKPFSFIGLGNTKRNLEVGTYYINGFWGDGCGLTKTKGSGINDIFIPSKALIYFEGVGK